MESGESLWERLLGCTKGPCSSESDGTRLRSWDVHSHQGGKVDSWVCSLSESVRVSSVNFQFSGTEEIRFSRPARMKHLGPDGFPFSW